MYILLLESSVDVCLTLGRGGEGAGWFSVIFNRIKQSAFQHTRHRTTSDVNIPLFTCIFYCSG